MSAEARNVGHYVNDLEALIDNLELDRFGLVGHDIGAFLAQEYIRRHPDRLVGLFVFNCRHFSLKKEWIEKDHVSEIWYKSFHQLPLAKTIAGSSRSSCRAYLAHFLNYWAG